METGISTAKLDYESGERFQRLRNDLGVTSFGLNLMLFQPGGRSRVHRHGKQEEVYLVLEGSLTLSVEGEETDYGVGELVRVGPEVRRQLVNRGRKQLALLALGGHGEHEGRDGMAYDSWESDEPKSPADVEFPPNLPEPELR
jgi:uncharacterized cupin superfamily protein